MIVGLRDTMGIPVVMTLTILGAETSLGDPALGGPIVKAYNWGCLKAGSTDTPWGALSNGTVEIRGVKWFRFPSPEVGMRAWGLYIAHGPTWNPGYYLKSYPNWEDIAAVYYGSGVQDYSVYLRHLEQLAAKFSGKLKAGGYEV